MVYLVAFPASTENLCVLKLTLDQIFTDAIMSLYAEQIEKLRICETMLIRNRYLVIRVA